jgi:UDP-perosamine 4-acetyltransferase
MSTVSPIWCLILGGGGHARVLIDSLLSSGEVAEHYGVLDRDRSLWGNKVLGVRVLGGDALLHQLASQGATHFVVGLGGLGDNQPRRRLFELALSHGMTPLTVCHSSAIRSRWATVGDGSAIFPGAVVNAGATIGVNVIVNTGAVVEHDCVVGDHVHIATGSRLCSTVHIGTGAHIGAGATVRQLVTIGEGAIVGAGAVVVKDVEPWAVVVGVPARVMERRVADTPNLASTSQKVVS